MRTAAASLVLAFLTLAWLPQPASPAAFTTESCMFAGLEQCRDAEGGAAARSRCLKAALAGCSYHCPTMDADCALLQMESAAVEYWRDDWTVMAVGDACRVKAQCSPPPPLRLPPFPEP